MLAGEKKTEIPLVMMIQDSFVICWKKIPLTSLEKEKIMGPYGNRHKYRWLGAAKPTGGNSCQAEVL